MEQLRENRTIQEMVRAMMDEAVVPHTFWGEVAQASLYLSNRTQLRPNSDKTPYKLWKGRPTSKNTTRYLGANVLSKRMIKILENLILMLMRVYFQNTQLEVKDTSATKKEKIDLRTTLIQLWMKK